jgi:hypothetical protein
MEEDDLTSSEEDNRSSCGGTSEHASQQHARTGRKGDPRMHRAVGARLADPKISLFEALRIGGFDYLNDDDANAMDSEQITLGQRKNQLSRRLRLVQKQQQSEDGNASAHKKWPNKLTELFHGSGKKRCLPSSVYDETGLSDDPAMTYNKIQSLPDGSGVSPIRAKQHPDYYPLVVPLLHHRNFGILGNAELPTHLSSAGNPSSVQLQNAEAFAAPPSAMSNASVNFPFSTSFHGLVANGNFGVVPSPFAPQHQLPLNPSHVAINSLNQTAVSLGLTFEQLALALRSCNNLPQILSSSSKTPSKEQQQLALGLYHSEIRSLYQRAMLLAGYPPETIQEDERSVAAVQFMLTAWQQEGERLQGLLKRVPPNGNLPMKMNDAYVDANVTAEQGKNRKDDHSHHDSSHHHDHNHSHSMDHKDTNTINDENFISASNALAASSRHIHRLEGKCGHQPVLHQPAGGKPHIDFVIGDRVECYHGVPTSQDLHWPSNFSCEDVSCQDSCRGLQPPSHKTLLESAASSGQLPASSSHEWMAVSGGDPIVYERSALDFESDEWNFDFTASESLLGLVRLGETTSDATSHPYKPPT